MSKFEYVKISNVENVYGQKNLLQSELEILRLISGFKKYKKLRQEELKLKVSLKSKIAEALELIKKLDGQLPKTEYRPKVQRKNQKSQKRKTNMSLREEMSEIQEKLRRLQA